MRSRELARLVKDAAIEHIEWAMVYIDTDKEWDGGPPYVYADRDGIRAVCFAFYLADHSGPLASIDVVTASTMTIAEITNDLIEQFWMQEHD